MGFVLTNEYMPHYTYNDYVEWEGNWELINGFPYAMSPSPTWKHQRINVNIVSQLDRLLNKNKCNCSAILATDWIVEDDTVLQPDVSVTCKPVEGNFIINTPEIIFEILSPSNIKMDKGMKFEIYQLKGVLFYIIVDPALETFQIFQLIKGKYVKQESNKNIFEFKLNICSVKFDFSKIWPSKIGYKGISIKNRI